MPKALSSCLIIAALSLQALATCTQVQHAVNTACSSGSATCNITTSATGSGNAIVAWFTNNNAAGQSITGVTGGGTYSHCTNCTGSDTTATLSTDIFYTLSSSSGSTTTTVTRSATGQAWKAGMVEVSGTSLALDFSNNIDNSTGANPQNGVTPTIGGTNDCMFQIAAGGGTITSVGVYTKVDPGTNQGIAFAQLLNSTSTSPPTFGFAVNQNLSASGIFLKETGGTPGHNSQLPTLGVGN